MPAAIRRGRLPGRWRERLTLDDGRVLLLRPIESADAVALRQGFELLSAEEIRMRFLHPMRELSESLADRLSRPDPRRDLALVVAEDLPPGKALIGAVARASIEPDGREAEFALIVGRILSRQGLGHLLLRKLIHWARLKRLDVLYGSVLEENTAMLALAKRLQFRRLPSDHEPGLVRVQLDLRPRRN